MPEEPARGEDAVESKKPVAPKTEEEPVDEAHCGYGYGYW